MKVRIFTALFLFVLLLAAIFSPTHWPIFVFGLAVGYLGCAEIGTIAQRAKPFAGILGLAGMGIFFGLFLTFPKVPLFAWLVGTVVLSVIGIFGGIQIAHAKASDKNRALYAQVASLYVCMPITAIVLASNAYVVDATDFWQRIVLLAMVPVWGGDTGAIIVGKLFGRTPFFREISPSKTREGAFGYFAGSMLMAIFMGSILQTTIETSIGVGLIAGFFGQAGDLFESWLKRASNLKDSGALLPGHGGVLDRIDSILTAAPLILLFLLVIERLRY